MGGNDELQDLWDRAIIRAWKRNVPTIRLCISFVAEGRLLGLIEERPDSAVSFVQSSGLHRTGHLWWRQNVRIWVADYFNSINDMLWDNAPEERILARLKKLEPCRCRAACRDDVDKNRERRQGNQLRSWDNHSHLRDWNVMKPVRSKHARPR